MTGSVTGIRRRRGVAGRRETPHLPLDRDFYGQTLLTHIPFPFYKGWVCVCVSREAGSDPALVARFTQSIGHRKTWRAVRWFGTQSALRAAKERVTGGRWRSWSASIIGTRKSLLWTQIITTTNNNSRCCCGNELVDYEPLAFALPPCGAPGAEVARGVRHLAPGLAIESLRLRCADPVAKLTEALDADAMDSGVCIPGLLFPLPTRKAELSRRRAGTRRV